MEQGGPSVHGPSEPRVTDSPRFRARQERDPRVQERARPRRLGRRATILLSVALAAVSAWVLRAAFVGGGAGRRARDSLVGTGVVVAVLGGFALATAALFGLIWCVTTLAKAILRRIPAARHLEPRPLDLTGHHPFEPNVFRSRNQRMAQFSTPLLMVLVVLAALWLPRAGDLEDLPLMTLFTGVPTLVIVAVTGWRQRLQVDRVGVRIVHAVRQVSIPWSWITDVTIKNKSTPEEGPTIYQVILVTDRDHVPVPTPSSPEREEMEALRAFLLRGRDLARADEDRSPHDVPGTQPTAGQPRALQDTLADDDAPAPTD